MKQLVRLRVRQSRDGKTFAYFLDYRDENNKRRRLSLGHADRRKAERQRTQKERELRMGIVMPHLMRLNSFAEDSLERTGDQIRVSTRQEYESTMRDFVDVVGNMDFQLVTFKHGEQFRQACLDKGNCPSTVGKKLKHLKRLFQLAVERGQIEANPLKRVMAPKLPKKTVEVYTADECSRILKVARDGQKNGALNWELLIIVAVTTGMRRGELLNLVWSDIDFETKTVQVCPKKSTPETWAWLVKDTDRRILPLTDEVLSMLADYQAKQPEGHPYVFVPPWRYEYIQQIRNKGKWSLTQSRTSVVNRFNSKYKKMLKKARVRELKFHDLRNTALSNWFAQGMREFDVMNLAGHSSFATTHKFYLAVADDLIDRARDAAAASLRRNLARAGRTPS